MNRAKLFFERVINNEIDSYISELNEMKNIDNVDVQYTFMFDREKRAISRIKNFFILYENYKKFEIDSTKVDKESEEYKDYIYYKNRIGY